MEEAIEHYQAALEVYTHEGFPEKRAEIQFNLDTLYYKLSRNQRGNFLEVPPKTQG